MLIIKVHIPKNIHISLSLITILNNQKKNDDYSIVLALWGLKLGYFDNLCLNLNFEKYRIYFCFGIDNFDNLENQLVVMFWLFRAYSVKLAIYWAKIEPPTMRSFWGKSNLKITSIFLRFVNSFLSQVNLLDEKVIFLSLLFHPCRAFSEPRRVVFSERGITKGFLWGW